MNIIITKVTPKKQGVGKKGPWTISEVVTNDGQKFDTFDTFEAGQEYEVTVEKNQNPQYADSIKKVKQQSNYQAVKQAQATAQILSNADDKEQRITMLSCMSSAVNYYAQRSEASEEKVMEFAKKLFHQAMTHKFNDLPF